MSLWLSLLNAPCCLSGTLTLLCVLSSSLSASLWSRQSEWLPGSRADEYGPEHHELRGPEGAGRGRRGRTPTQPHPPQPGLLQRLFPHPPVCWSVNNYSFINMQVFLSCSDFIHYNWTKFYICFYYNCSKVIWRLLQTLSDILQAAHTSICTWNLTFFSLLLPLHLFPPLFFSLSSFSSCPYCFCYLAPSSISSIYNGASRGGKARTSTGPSCYPSKPVSLAQSVYSLILKSPLILYLSPSLQISPAFPIPPSSCSSPPQPHRARLSNPSLTSWLCCYGDGCPWSYIPPPSLY